MELQRFSAGGNHGPAVAPPIVHEVLRSAGQPLESQTRQEMESNFGHDFSRVRIHSDAKAAESAKRVGALAYTVGQNIVFGRNGFTDTTSAGRRLLAHELTHTIQQDKGQASTVDSGEIAIGAAGDACETEADQLAQRVSETTSSPHRLRRPNSVDHRPIVRRTVDVSAESASLAITAQPTTSLKIDKPLSKWRVVPFTDQAIEFSGSAMASCAQGDSTAGYGIGIVQIETNETNNARYLGGTPADGSVWVHRDTPAARPVGVCMDSEYQRFWHGSDPVSLSCGQSVSTKYKDFPKDFFYTSVQNTLTNKPNFLSEIHLAFQFATALMLKRPDNSLQTLRWVGWDLSWDYTFDTAASGQPVVKKGISMTNSVSFTHPEPAPAGFPTGPTVPAKNCNTLGYEAGDKPEVQPSSSW